MKRKKFPTIAAMLEGLPERMRIEEISIRLRFREPADLTRGDLQTLFAAVKNALPLNSGVDLLFENPTVEGPQPRPARPKRRKPKPAAKDDQTAGYIDAIKNSGS